MPQASDWLRKEFALFFGEEAEAFEALEYLRERGYTEKSGWISPPPAMLKGAGLRGLEARKTGIAIDYLCEEWDFAYKERP